MSTTLLTTGLACMIAAIVGGGLRAFGVEIPLLQSAKRQGLLAGFGLILLVAAYAVAERPRQQTAAREILLFDNKNSDGVLNTPSRPAVFSIAEPHHVTSIWDYHWNGGNGATPGNIRLRRQDGKEFGPWEVFAADTESKINWECKPEVTIPAGTYTIVDSDLATWAWNPKTEASGMAKVKGYPAR
jgi:hypothetical protein